MSYSTDAEELINREPPCQQLAGGGPPIPCEPGCVHEQLQVERAKVHVLLGIHDQLDNAETRLSAIEAHLETIAGSQ